MKKIGPGFLITAAFIGPGTVTTATLAGAQFGYQLLWALLFSVFATLVLQEMAARVGVMSGKGLSETISQQLRSPLLRKVAMLLIVLAIGIGNAAYEAGNLTGSAIGMVNLLGGELEYWALAIGFVAMAILVIGKFEFLKLILTLMVLLMSLVFLVTLFFSEPQWLSMLKAVINPVIPDSSLVTIMALIGTTVVPYNLFLHASLAAKFSPNAEKSERISTLSRDSRLSISIGGLVTLAIVATAASTFFATQMQPNISNISEQLRPLLGDFAPAFFAIGLFAAGITSAITAPLAASYAVCGAMNWSSDMEDKKFKLIWMSILVLGTGLCFLGIKPLAAILLAQATNALLLPLVAIFLLWIVNKSDVMGSYKNSTMQNILGLTVVAIVIFLAGYKLGSMI